MAQAQLGLAPESCLRIAENGYFPGSLPDSMSNEGAGKAGLGKQNGGAVFTKARCARLFKRKRGRASRAPQKQQTKMDQKCPAGPEK